MIVDICPWGIEDRFCEIGLLEDLAERLEFDMDILLFKAELWFRQSPQRPDSGMNKKPRLSKTGNRYLRVVLYRPALNAARQDPQVRAYYHHLIETRGLKEIQAICAICAVMRKFLHVIHGMLKARTLCDSSRFYTPTETGAD